MIDFRSLVETYEQLNEATGAEVKKWFASKGLKGKASKIGRQHVQFVPDGEIPNELRTEIIKTVMPDARVLDWSNVSYGNIRSNYITLTHGEWSKLME